MNSPENPCHPTGKYIPAKVAREMCSVMGLEFCDVCHRAKAVRTPAKYGGRPR